MKLPLVVALAIKKGGWTEKAIEARPTQSAKSLRLL